MEFDSNDSPIIRLSAPHTKIIITPPRYSDGEAVISMLSDPRVYMNLAGPPYPYAQKEWDEWFPIIEKGSHDALLEWREAEKSRKDGGYGKRWVKGAPVIAIRDVDPVTREQKLIGIIGVARMDFMIKAANDENKRKQEVNEALDAGDPEIVWELGCKSCSFLSVESPVLRCSDTSDSLSCAFTSWSWYHARHNPCTDSRFHDSLHERTCHHGVVFSA
jgi:hypothetical protein